MAHNQEMLSHNKATWGDKVRIIGLSLDQDLQKLRSHITNKGWANVEHYLAANGSCTADQDFEVQGIPHVVLVDTNGKIVFVGHPAHRKNLEADINALLAGQSIQ